MSSPLAKTHKSWLERLLIRGHHAASHSRRVEILARLIADLAQRETASLGAPLTCLDVGCGDMTLSRRLGALWPASRWQGVDIHAPPADSSGVDWRAYQQFDGRHLPFADDSIDVVLLCDVLHHAAPADQQPLLAECARVARHLVVWKDHFEYGPWSRTMLKIMDFVGNWAYGIRAPDYYFTPARALHLARQSGLVEARRHTGIQLYAHLPLVRSILRPEWQFIALLRPQ